MKRTIRLGHERTVTLGNYLKAWRAVRRAPTGTEFKESLCGWWPASRETILQQYSDGVHDRINRHLPFYRKGRKWNQDWQRMMLQAARQLNTPRLCIHWLPMELRKRFAQRVA